MIGRGRGSGAANGRRVARLAVATRRLVAVAGVTALAACGQAGDTVSTGQADDTVTEESISAVLTSGGGPATTATPASTSGGPTTSVAVTTSGVAATSTSRPAATTTAPSTTAAPSAAAVRVLGVDCARHSEDGGDWLVFHLASLEVSATAAYGTAPVTVAGDNTLLVTITPAIDATAGRYDFTSSCDWVRGVAAAPRAGDTLTFVVGTAGRPRVLGEPVVGQSLRGGALVVKIGA